MNKKILITSLLLLVLFATLTSAASVTGESVLEMCQCETTKETYQVCANTTGTYGIDAVGTAAEWFSIAPTSLTLAAGECEDVFVFVTPKCYATSGTFNTTLNLTGNESASKDIAVRVNQCHTFNYSVTPTSNESKACEANTYNIYVKNTGEFTDEFVLNQAGLTDSWVTYPRTKFVLTPNEVLNTVLVVDSACTAEATAYPFTLELSNTRTNAAEKENLSFAITDFASITNTFPSTITTCSESAKEFTFNVKNLSDQNDVFTLALDAPEAISLSTNTIELASNETTQVTLMVAQTEPLTGFIGLTITSGVYGKEYRASSELDIQDCYAHKVERVSTQTINCIGANEEKVLVTNLGTKDSTMTLVVEGITTEQKQITVPANTAEEVTLPYNKNEVENVVVSVTTDSGYNISTIDYNLEFEDCYGTNLVAPSLAVCKGKVTTEIITLTNNGTKTQNYTLETNADWIALEKEAFALNTGEVEEITMNLTVPQTLQDNYTVKAISDNVTIQRSLPVTVLSTENCYAFEPIMETKNLDVNCCSGEIAELTLKNKGQFDQTISLSKEAPEWVTFSEDEVAIKEGEEKIVFVYFSPPAGTNGIVTSIINIVNEQNVSETIDYNLNVIGGNCGEVLSVDLNVNNKVADETILTRKEFKVEFEIYNDSNIGFNVLEMSVDDYNAYFEFEEGKFLSPEERMIVAMTVVFEEKDVPTEPADVNVSIITSVGEFHKKQRIDFVKQEVEQELLPITADFTQFVAPAAGILLLIIILALIVIVAARAKPKSAVPAEPKKAAKPKAKKTKKKSSKKK